MWPNYLKTDIMKTKRLRFILIFPLAILLGSCEPISYKDYRMEPYTGAFTWKEVTKKAAWSNRYDHAAVAFDGKLWVIGGYDSGRTLGDSYLEDVWNSTDGERWSLVTASAPWKGRRGHSVTVFDDGTGEALYLVGGFEVDEETGYRQYTNDVWRSTDGKNWTRIKERTYPVEDMNADFMPRFNHTCVAANHGGTNYLYLMGGSTMLENYEGTYSFIYLHDVWRSEDGATWIKLDNNDFGQRSEQAACVDPATGRIYMHGGMHSVTFDNEELYNDPGAHFNEVWYSDDGITWQVDETFSLVRAGHSMLMYDGSLWLFPGKVSDNIQLRITEEDLYYTYSKAGGEMWTLDSKGSAFSGRHSYATVEFDGRIWVLGGETADNGPNNDVWCGTIGD
jgi:hypothetical protein